MTSSIKLSEKQKSNINLLVNANATPMVEGTWAEWSAQRIKKGLDVDRLMKIAYILSKMG